MHLYLKQNSLIVESYEVAMGSKRFYLKSHLNLFPNMMILLDISFIFFILFKFETKENVTSNRLGSQFYEQLHSFAPLFLLSPN